MNDSGSYHVHSEARGPHWIAWISRAAGDQPEDGVLLIGETREEAETRARQWITSPYRVSRG